MKNWLKLFVLDYFVPTLVWVLGVGIILFTLCFGIYLIAVVSPWFFLAGIPVIAVEGALALFFIGEFGR